MKNRCLTSDNRSTGNRDEQNPDHESEEDASLEGGIVRNLFQMSSSSSSLDTTTTAADEEEDPMSFVDSTVQDPSHILHEQLILNDVILAQQGMKTISNILWPCATFLASFVFNFYRDYVEADSSSTPICAPTPTTRNYSASSWIRPPPHTNLGSQHECLDVLYEILSATSTTPFSILELGAGVGYTGLKLAKELPCTVQLTDLEEAMSLLTENIRLNSHQFHLGPSAVSCVPLIWGTPQESYSSTILHQQNLHKWLLLASDCVYYEELHLPLEQTLAALLSNPRNTSDHHQLCLLAGMRRWKRDTTFYSKLGRRTRTATHTLQCTCLHEVVERSRNTTDHRSILRIYAVRWVARSTTEV